MKVEIWSDIVCPFCYIGKRKFEMALDQFEKKDEVEIVWKSFQLDASTQTTPGISIVEHLAEKKGISVEQSMQLHENVTQAAAEVGLKYDFDKAIMANTLDAHRLSHLAAGYGLQNAMEERLFSAYFSEGKNIADTDTLIFLAEEIGLNPEEVRLALNTNKFSNEVQSDILEAQEVGVRGVPFFVLNRKYAVSGAQPSELFLEVLQKVLSEETQTNLNGSPSCTLEGNCD